MTANELIKKLSDMEIRMRLDGEHVRWAAPPGIVRGELLAEMKVRKAEILALLKAKKIGERKVEVPISPKVVKRGEGDFPQVFRPCRISEVYGQEEVKKVITHGLNTGALSHVLLFQGISGTGKTTMGRIVAMGLNCVHGPTSEPCCECEPCKAVLGRNSFAYQELDAAQESGVDAIRQLRQGLPCASLGGERNKIILFDESYRLSEQAQAALLKPIEDSMEDLYFIFCTTERMIKPLENRCMQFKFDRLSSEELRSLIFDVCTLEKLKVNPSAIQEMIDKSEGMPRNALLMLQQASARAAEFKPYLNKVLLGD